MYKKVTRTSEMSKYIKAIYKNKLFLSTSIKWKNKILKIPFQ